MLGRRLGLLALALPVLAPCLWLLSAWQSLDVSLWSHLSQHVLPNSVLETLAVLLGVAAGTLLLGAGTGWLIGRCEFVGRRLWEWLLLLPLALPPYVLAFAYLGLADYFGLPGRVLRESFAIDWLPPAPHGPLGGILIMSLALYPYVYLLLRESFARQPASLVESARLLGLGPWASFWRVQWPLARPALLAAIALVSMECLAEFGAMSVLGVDSLTVVLYRTWFSLQSLQTAAQLASLLLGCVALLGLLVALSRTRLSYASLPRPRARRRLSRWQQALAWALLATLLLFALILPLLQLLAWASTAEHPVQQYREAIMASLKLAGMAALLALVLGLPVALIAAQQRRDRRLMPLAQLGHLGYAVPGTVLALGLMIVLTALESWLRPADAAPWLLSTSVLALLLAYQARFARLAHAPLASALAAVRPSMREAAQTLGAGALERSWRLHLPLLRPAAFAALLMVFVEVIKELPATLILRPIGWDTLATRIYAYTSEGQWDLAALPALLLILAGLLPVAILARQR